MQIYNLFSIYKIKNNLFSIYFMKAIERVYKYIDFIGIKAIPFEKKIGLSNGYLGKQLVRKADLGEGILMKIIENCPEISPEWLLTGEGEMLKEGKKSNLSPITTPKKDKIGIEQQGIPLIPLDAMAGFGTGGIQVMDYETQRYIVPDFTELKTDYIIRVQGNSMTPTYNSGDLVACKRLALTDIFFQWNRVYVLDTVQGAIIKRIKKGKEGCILIVSDNKEFDPIELPLTNINAIAIVLGVIRLD